MKEKPSNVSHIKKVAHLFLSAILHGLSIFENNIIIYNKELTSFFLHIARIKIHIIFVWQIKKYLKINKKKQKIV